jgi:hypothetical protein
MTEHYWLTPFAEIEERLSWRYTRTRYENETFTVWARDHNDRPIYLQLVGPPVNWASFELATPREIKLAKILHLDWSLKEGNPLDDLLSVLENGGFPDGKRTD